MPMQSKYGAWDLVRAAGQMAREGARAISPVARTTLPVGRGLWRLGWVLWGLTAVPIVIIAYEASLKPECQWEVMEVRAWEVDGSPVLPPGQTQVSVPGVGTAYVPEYFTVYESEKAIANLKKDRAGRNLLTLDEVLAEVAYTCTVHYGANRPMVVLYSALGLSGMFVLIQGGFSMILWVILGFRKN